MTMFADWKYEAEEFTGGPVVRILGFQCRAPSSIPSQGTKTPQATQDDH